MKDEEEFLGSMQEWETKVHKIRTCLFSRNIYRSYFSIFIHHPCFRLLFSTDFRVYLDDEIVISIERCYCRCNYYWLWIVIKHFDWLWMDKKKYRKVEKRVPAKNELILNSSSFLLTEILVNFQKVLFFGETFSLNKQRVSQQAW